MKPTVLAALFLATGIAQAECYMTSATTVANATTVEAVDNVRYMAGNGVCTITARVQYNKKWHNVMGIAKHPTRDTQTLCLDAVENGVRDFLVRQEGKTINAEQQSVCTDMPQIKEKLVAKGEIVQISQLQPHPDRPAFMYQGAECRWFVETVLNDGAFRQSEGVACRIGQLNQDRWVVVDKW